MKRIIAFLLTFFSVWPDISAQEYKSIRSNKESYYINNNGYIKGIKIDSVKTVSNDTIVYNFKTIRKDSSRCTLTNSPIESYFTPYGASWAGEKIIFKSTGVNIFFNARGDSIKINTLKEVGQSWLCYIFKNQNLLIATVVAKQQEQVLNEIDSVKTIKLFTYDRFGNSIDNIFNDKTIKLSKRNGLIKTYDMYNFPEDTVAYHRTIKGRLKTGDIYNYEVGDEFQVEIMDYKNTYTLSYVLNKVLTKTEDTAVDSVSYEIERTVIKYDYVFSMTDLKYHLENPTTIYDTIIKNYTHLSHYLFNTMPEQSTVSDHGLISYNLISNKNRFNGKIISDLNWNDNYQNTKDSCWLFSAIFDGSGYSTQYIEGLGSLYNENGLSYGYNESIVYYKKANEIEGKLFTYVPLPERKNEAISLFPNPSNNEAIINIGNLLKGKLTIALSDVTGTHLKELELLSNNENIQFTTSDLPNGVYFLSIKNGQAYFIKKLVVQH